MNKATASSTVPGTRTTYALQGEREMVMERVYDAPRESVFRAFCDPKRVPDWWGPGGWTTKVEAMDVRPGGVWRFSQRDPQGATHVFHGTYRDVVPPRRIVTTFEYEGAGGKVIVETYEFLEEGPQTLIRVTSTYPSGDALGGMMRAGMESAGAWPEGTRHQWRLERLAALVGH